MSNTNLDITINDFENICRTCLSRENLKPLYEKRIASTCLTEMLMSCTSIKFAEDDGLPVKICANCIHEINQACSFAKRCVTTDTILRKCVKKTKTELANNSPQSQIIDPIIKAEEEMQIEIEPENLLPNIVFVACEYAEEVKQEEDTKIEIKQEIFSPTIHRTVQNVLEEQVEKIEYAGYMKEIKEEDVTIEPESDETYHDLVDEEDEDQDTIHFEKSHSKIQKDVLPYTCLVCEKTFHYLGHYNVHMRRHSGEKHNVCVVCSKAFMHPRELKIHMRIHTGEKPYSCGVCSKAFSVTGSLKDHMRIHTGEKPYTCEVCSKTFTQSTSLKFHMRIHTGEKPYICGICSKAFTQPSYLTVHMRTHTKEKRYTCGVCNKAFTRPHNVKYHMRLHTGEKPNTCTVCSRTFTQACTLKAHMRLHTGERPYSCGICDKSYTTNGALTIHKRTHKESPT